MPIKEPLKVPEVINEHPFHPDSVSPPITTAIPITKSDAQSSSSSTTLYASAIVDSRSVPVNSSYYRLHCPHGHLLSYWRPLTDHDSRHRVPYIDYGPRVKYVTFEPDVGGWNNIRMQMELVLVFAYATGRTLVLPPDQPMYLLQAGKGHQKAHSFADFFPFEKIQERMSVITMEEFLQREAVAGHLRNRSTHLVQFPPGNKTVFNTMEREERWAMWAYLRDVSACPPWKSMHEFLVIPSGPHDNRSATDLSEPEQQRLAAFAANRTAMYYDDDWQNEPYLHFISKPELGYRLLEHFYTFIYFENQEMERFFKRFVRDYVHYQREIFCKAALIVEHLLREGNGSYTAFHVRRGEFQYKVVKLSGEKILNNLQPVMSKTSLVYIATDERNKTFFHEFPRRYKVVRFLDHYMDYAKLRDINPNYLGMIDQIICSHGSYFVGTWFSTFTGYITRMRGYIGFPDNSTFFGDKEHRDRFQQVEAPKFPFYMREFPTAWDAIEDA
ncbi:hypothetical protein EON64_09565 [archaeon]|nr:MAG: hypothetical protein EON64_09565 [archaeon]